mmetsp:Transcript_41885/g.105284  ORF Transcript_41885/g.105284 Transcript_41885/m.105284 type:complete len:200 (-) Transcript_41885:11-610(-)
MGVNFVVRILLGRPPLFSFKLEGMIIPNLQLSQNEIMRSSSFKTPVTLFTKALTSKNFDHRDAPLSLPLPVLDPPLAEDLADFLEPAEPIEKLERPRFSMPLPPCSPVFTLPEPSEPLEGFRFNPPFKLTSLPLLSASGSFHPASSIASPLVTINSTDGPSPLFTPSCTFAVSRGAAPCESEPQQAARGPHSMTRPAQH